MWIFDQELYKGYGTIIMVCVPLFFFIIAVTFRLLDNSASVFLSNHILVASTYVSQKLIKQLIQKSAMPAKIRKELKRALIFRKLHNFFMILMLLSILFAIIYK